MHFVLPVLSLMRARLAWAQAAELEGLWWRPPALYTECREKGGVGEGSVTARVTLSGAHRGSWRTRYHTCSPQREAYAESEIESPCSLQEEAAVPTHALDLVFGL